LVPGIAAPPQNDATKYLSVLTGGLATLTRPAPSKSLSFLLGSMDEYNKITFQGANGFTKSFDGDDLNSPPTATSRRLRPIAVLFHFRSQRQDQQVLFSSSGNSFEFDNIAVNDPPSDVPEPLTLSLFASGLAGAAFLRRRRLQTVRRNSTPKVSLAACSPTPVSSAYRATGRFFWPQLALGSFPALRVGHGRA